MLHTRLCDLLGIQHPIIQAAMGTASSAELAAAVSNAGGLGSIGTLFRPLADLRRQLERISELTNRPYAVNHVVPVLDEAAFQATLDARPRVISFALGAPGEHVKRAHEAGALVMHQVTNVRQAEEAARQGVDILVAQGSESGGYGGSVAALPLVPQVVDAVHPVHVVAAGGIFDGRGVAAALLLGADGVNLGTRFLASPEASIDAGWCDAILAAASEDAVKVDVLNDLMPLPGTGGYGTVVRSVRTPFIDAWNARRDEARARAAQLMGEMGAARRSGRSHEFLAVAGQTAGAVRDVRPAAEIVRGLVEEAEQALRGRGASSRRKGLALRRIRMYSNMLYMKTRITFRIAPELADALRQLPNQTTFVERVLRDALGRACPLCDGHGRLPRTELEISDFRESELPPLDRDAALQLKQVVRLGRELAATRLELSGGASKPVAYRLARGKQVLLTGALDESAPSRPH